MSENKDWVQEIVNIMARLRAPDGCPWDQKQTHKTLKPYLIEESCEVIDAIDSGDMKHLEEELGDVLMNLVFHAQLASEKNIFTFQDVARNISEKMVHRHPHVFAEANNLTPEEVEAQWEKIKAEEKSERESILDGIPNSLPALMRAQKIQRKAAKVGFDWPDERGPREKISEEMAELEEAIASGDQEEVEKEFGDLLFSMVNLARHLNIDADHALNLTNRKFTERFKYVEKSCKEQDVEMKTAGLEKLDEFWDEAKALEKKG
ncbi:MAG: nucleoside triphosphate pyrophosphohydrolase [Lentisphaeraceae bacterium]|nr:nucleoside triphosphate pyrophosphohydrolase [Lentisphaeraceae bacterium]